MDGKIVVDVLFSILWFYTNINLILVFFYKYTAKYYDLHFSCLVVALISFGITYICPREILLKVDQKRQYIFPTGSISSVVIDLVMHWIPLVFVFLVVPVSRNPMLPIRTFAIIILYMIITQAHDLYMFDHFITIIFLLLAIVARFSI